MFNRINVLNRSLKKPIVVSKNKNEIGWVAIGSNVKSISLEGNVGKIGGYSVLFTNPEEQDFHGNNFSKNTFLGHTRGDMAVATFNHRMPIFDNAKLDPSVKKLASYMKEMVMKNPIHTTEDEIGIFSELICDLSDKYEKMVYDLAKAGKLKWSSGTAPQLFKAKKSGELEMFVIAEQALTPVPAEYRMIQNKVMPIKAYMEFINGVDFVGTNT